MNRTDDQFVIMVVSEELDRGLEQMKRSIADLDLTMDERIRLLLSFNSLNGIASYMRAKKNQIAETRP